MFSLISQPLVRTGPVSGIYGREDLPLKGGGSRPGTARCSKGQEYKNVILYSPSLLLSAVATLIERVTHGYLAVDGEREGKGCWLPV